MPRLSTTPLQGHSAPVVRRTRNARASACSTTRPNSDSRSDRSAARLKQRGGGAVREVTTCAEAAALGLAGGQGPVYGVFTRGRCTTRGAQRPAQRELRRVQRDALRRVRHVEPRERVALRGAEHDLPLLSGALRRVRAGRVSQIAVQDPNKSELSRRTTRESEGERKWMNMGRSR